MNLKDIDLNLLVVFNELYMERRVSAVAEKLGLTQPAISNALSRLRRLMDDELFLRGSNGMEPTAYANQVAEPIAYALSSLHTTLNQRTTFDPATSQRKFTIGLADLGEIYLLPALMDTLERLAPGVSISTVRSTAVNLADEMEAGHIDLSAGLLPQLKSGYMQRRLFTQRYVCMFRQGHALDKEEISIEEFSAAEHVAVTSPGTGHAKVEELLAHQGVRRRIRLTLPHFVSVGHVLQSTQMIATVPERYAMQCVRPFQLRYVRHPVALPEISINLFWHAKNHKEHGNQWLRRLIFDTFSD
ncbi:MAG: LysR family transcriptional regulator [Pseudomonadota bacterium]